MLPLECDVTELPRRESSQKSFFVIQESKGLRWKDCLFDPLCEHIERPGSTRLLLVAGMLCDARFVYKAKINHHSRRDRPTTMITRKALLLLCLPMLLSAQTPEWAKNFGKSSRHPELTYLTGFGTDKPLKNEDPGKSLQRAIDVARGYLVQRVRVQIQNTFSSAVEERNRQGSAYVKNATQSTSSMEIQGLETETFYDDDEEVAYAFAFVAKERLAKIYGERETKLRREIRQRTEAAKKYEGSGSKTKALDEYLACYPLFRQLEEAETILLVTRSSADEAFKELLGDAKKDEVSLTLVREAVRRLVEQPIKGPEDVAWHVAYCMREQLDLREAAVMVSLLTYQDTKMASPFSRLFKQMLESKLNEVAHWTPVHQLEVSQPRTRNLLKETAESSGATHVLRGAYWEQGGNIRFLVDLLRVSDSKQIGSVETVVPESVVQAAGLSLKPQNFKAAFAEQKVFNTDEVVGGGLSLEVWTNKGSEDLVFTKGERMQIFVRTNMSCHIRFVYHLANGQRALLLADHLIDESKVNLVYQIPQEFECDEPFGAEFLQVFARTDAFDPIETERVDGYDILKEDLRQFLAKQRGMKKVKQGTLQTETRVVMTTMEK